MATPCRVGLVQGDGSVLARSATHNGCLTEVGLQLYRGWRTEAEVLRLLESEEEWGEHFYHYREDSPDPLWKTTKDRVLFFFEAGRWWMWFGEFGTVGSTESIPLPVDLLVALGWVSQDGWMVGIANLTDQLVPALLGAEDTHRDDDPWAESIRDRISSDLRAAYINHPSKET